MAKYIINNNIVSDEDPMPNKGNDPSPQCGSFETPPGLSGLGALLGTAIQEKDGITILKFNFPLSHRLKTTSVKTPEEKVEEAAQQSAKAKAIRP
jgi:hypothetical protein